MSTTAIILAGGKGTRSADPRRAKITQVLGNRSLLEWQLRALQGSAIQDVVIVTGHLNDQVEDLVSDLGSLHPKVSVVHETQPSGTVPAVRFAANAHSAERYLVILGDLLVSFPVDAFLSAWATSDKHVGVIVHPSTHPHDSDLVFRSWYGGVAFRGKHQANLVLPNMASTGVFGLTADALIRYGEARDIGSEVLGLSASQDDLFTYISSHFFKDTGTPDRLQGARTDLATGAFERRGSSGKRRALFLDRDGVLNPGPEVLTPEAMSLVPGVGDAIREVNASGVPVLVVTNQPAIAKGQLTFAAHEQIRAALDHCLGEYGAFVDDYFFCPHHPDQGFPEEVAELKVVCVCRKPKPGMALAAAEQHGIDLRNSIMIGDTARDHELAESTGMDFVHVTRSCDLIAPHTCCSSQADAISLAAKMLTC